MAVTDGGAFHHTCFVVHDVDATAAKLEASLGIGPWHFETIEPPAATMRGRPARLTFRIALAPVGEAFYELLAPVSGESIYAEHLAERGEGFHHTCIRYETHGALRAAKRELSDQGRTIVQSGDFGDAGEFCYFEIPETGALLELLYLAG